MSPTNDAQVKNEREKKEQEELQKLLEEIWGVELESSMPVETEDKDDNSS